MNDSPAPLVLLHGLGLNKFWMLYAARHFERAGFQVFNFNYPSRRASIADNARRFADFLAARKLQQQPLHFLTHSLGSIVLRKFLALRAEEKTWQEFLVTRAVMLGPPHQGSQVAARLRTIWPIRWYFGEALDELATLSLPPGSEHLEIGTIIGNIGRPKTSWIWQEDSDGVVSLKEAELAGVREAIELPVRHTAMIFSARTLDHAMRFLRTGSFT